MIDHFRLGNTSLFCVCVYAEPFHDHINIEYTFICTFIIHVDIFPVDMYYRFMFLFLPFTEEIRLKILGSQDLPDFRVDLLGDRDSAQSRENLFEMLGTPVITYLICMGTPVKILADVNISQVRSPPSVFPFHHIYT